MYELLGFRQDHDIKKKVTGLHSDKAFFHGLGISTSRKDRETITNYVFDITKDFFQQFLKDIVQPAKKTTKISSYSYSLFIISPQASKELYDYSSYATL